MHKRIQGGRTRRSPAPNGHGPVIFYATNAFLLVFIGINSFENQILM